MCYIKKGEAYQILSNGFVVYKNKSYPLSDCSFEEATQASSVQEIEIDPQDSKSDKAADSKTEKSDSKKEQKPKRDKKVSQNQANQQPDQNHQSKPDDQPELLTQTESDMPPIPQAQPVPQQPLNIQIPNAQQVLTPQQFLQFQQLQQQMLQQQQAIQVDTQPQTTPTLPLPAIIPPTPTDKTQAQPTHIPEELKMLQDFMHLTGGNIFLAIALVAAALFFKQWKAKNESSNDRNQLDAHSSACDLERRDLSAKLSNVEAKLNRLDSLDERIEALEDSDQDIQIGFSDEIEKRILSLEKQFKDIQRSQAGLDKRPSTSSREAAQEHELDSQARDTTVSISKPRGRKPKA